ncbi:MAG TPA: hypothetical protein VFQ39_18430, partial [Longimicrobium sp.]|nr:hypothetical protein [Longimicrobium sp.]
MKDERMDPEVLGALLDRRLAGDERAAAVAHLAASEEDRDVLADTAAVLRALEEEDAGASETEAPSKVRGGGEAPASSRPARSMPRWGWGALA